MPALHTSPIEHATPQAPQFFGSLPVLVQPVMHGVWPVGHPASPPMPESPASW
jgi:hypothetical protein